MSSGRVQIRIQLAPWVQPFVQALTRAARGCGGRKCAFAIGRYIAQNGIEVIQ